MVSEIISVGTEILMGEIVNTDAQYLAKKFNELGYDHYHQETVGDNFEKLMEVLEKALSRADVIVTTGGLGPTDDDMTKECVAKFVNRELVLNDEALENIKSYLEKNNFEFTKNNEKQAYLPENAIIIKNELGTAPGFILELENDKVIIVLPGPPHELQPMFENYALPYLQSKCDDVFCSTNVQVFGLFEAQVEEKIKDLIETQTNPTIATYCHQGYVTIRITSKAKTQEEAVKLNSSILDIVKERMGKNIFEIGERTLNEVVCEYLIKNGITISVSESCSGGLVSDALVKVPGISSVYQLGVISYSNNAKMSVLKVKEDTLKEFGAVSFQTAVQMAQGVRQLGGTDIGISTTGIAGPKSDDTKKPVGLVYIALSTKDETIYKELHLNGSREKIRNMTVLNVFNMIREYFNI